MKNQTAVSSTARKITLLALTTLSLSAASALVVTNASWADKHAAVCDCDKDHTAACEKGCKDHSKDGQKDEHKAEKH